MSYNEQQNRALLKLTEPSTRYTYYDGFHSEDNQVMGTYLHGLFDHSSSCLAMLQWAGFNSKQRVNLNDIREQQLDRLATVLIKSLQNTEIFNLA